MSRVLVVQPSIDYNNNSILTFIRWHTYKNRVFNNSKNVTKNNNNSLNNL